MAIPGWSALFRSRIAALESADPGDEILLAGGGCSGVLDDGGGV
jgi:hypothetical protein